MKEQHNSDHLAGLLGANRAEPRIDQFVRDFDPPPEITVDKEDSAYDEFVEFKAHGFGLAFEHDVLQAVHLDSGQQADGYARYELPHPMGVQLQQSKSEVLALLPPPDVEGGGHEGFFGQIPEWIRYDRLGGHSVHFEFTPVAEVLAMVTLMQSPAKKANNELQPTAKAGPEPWC